MQKEVKIALVAITGLVVLFFGMNFLKGLSLFSENDVYYVTFKNVGGVDKNTPVYADGVRVGLVDAINYDYNHSKPTTLTISVSKHMRIPAGSMAEVSSDLMSNTSVKLLLSNNMRERLNPGDTIKGSEDEGTMAKLKAMLPTIEAMAPKLDSILTSLNTLLSDPALKSVITNVDQMTGRLAVASTQLNTLMTKLNKDVPVMMGKVDGVLDNAQTITSNLAGADLKATIEKVNATLAGVQQTVDKLNSKEGTVGKLLNDPSLYDNLNATMVHADSLVIDLKAHPKRYVHFSVFGRKN